MACTIFSIMYVFFISALVPTSWSIGYRFGRIYNYKYDTSAWLDVNSTVLSGVIDISFDLSITPLLDSLDLTLYKLEVKQASSLSEPDLSKSLSTISLFPTYFTISHNTVRDLYYSENDKITDVNVKKGIIGLLQFEKSTTKGIEVNVMGECEAIYSINGSSVTKKLFNCKNSRMEHVYLQNDEVMGVHVDHVSYTQYDLSDDVIQLATSYDDVVAGVNIKQSQSANAHSRQNLSLIGTVDNQVKVTGITVDDVIKTSGSLYIKSLLPASHEPAQCTKDVCQQSKDVLDMVKSDLTSDKLATVESAKAFVALAQSLKSTNKHDIDKLLESHDDILPQLIDAVVAAGISTIQSLYVDRLDFNDIYGTDFAERYLFALSHIKHPDESLINHVLDLIDKSKVEKVPGSILLAAGALVHTFCKESTQCSSSTVVERYVTTIHSALSQCLDESCTLMYLRSISNAGLAATANDALMYVRTSSSRMVAITAIGCLRRINPAHIRSQIAALCSVVLDSTYDTSVRSAAFQAILEGSPDVVCMRNIIKAMMWLSSEFRMYIITAIVDRLNNNEQFRKAMLSVMSNPEYNNYLNIAVQGTSSAFTGYIAETNDVNSTYSLRVENSASGLLKRSTMVVDLVRGEHHFPLIKFGLYADGLEAMVSDEGEENDGEVAEPTAGMTLELNGVLVRPIEFFRGTGGLMSAAWNAPSELTSALQGNIMIIDHSQKVVLLNGFVTHVHVNSALSIDLSGSIAISLWSRNSQSLVRNSAAMWLDGEISLLLPSGSTGVKFSGEAATFVDFKTDVDFYDMPIKMCLQMSRPDFEYTEKYQSFEMIQKTKLIKTRRRSTQMGGVSFPLHPRNNQQCLLLESL